MRESKLNDILARVKSFPSMPGAGAKMLSLLEKPDTTVTEIEEILRYDPGLTANVLKLANSAYFGIPSKIGSLKQAVILLGLFVKEELEAIHSLATNCIPFVVAENMILGTDHAEIGAHILANWNLPGEVINAVRWHHDPDSPDASNTQMDVIYLANILCQTPDTSGPEAGHAVELSPAVIDRLGIQLDQFDGISEKVAHWVDELSDALAFS
jgi:HD-like signal output (HDOD) protein